MVQVARHKNDGLPSCSIKALDPIHLGTGNVYLSEVDYTSAGPDALKLQRYYNSQSPLKSRLGKNWRHTFDRALVYLDDPSYGPIAVQRPDGHDIFFVKGANGAWSSDADVVEKLVALGDGSWSFTDENDTVELFDSGGRLVSITKRGGFKTTLTYGADGNVATATNQFGRSLSFSYDTAGRTSVVTDPAGDTVTYNYGTNGSLATVTYQDATTRTFVYENASVPNAITGIIDENGQRFATWAYDSIGRAISNFRAGGTESGSIAYNSNGTTTVTDSNNQAHTYHFNTVFGAIRTSQVDGGPCSVCGAQTQSITYDANGFVASRTDLNGNLTTYVHDAMGRETSRTEAAGTAVARTITTTWHPTFRVPSRTTIGVRYYDSTYDTVGRLIKRGEAASTGARYWNYVYNAQGLPQSIDGSRTDVVDKTSYDYDAQGNLTSVTDALGYVTQITGYDAHGRATRIIDPNGLQTKITYRPRGQLQSVSVGTDAQGYETTTYGYDSAGNVTSVRVASGAAIYYHYDAAHRLTDINDQPAGLGNHIHYTLDAMGHRIKTEVFDTAGTLSRLQSQVFDQNYRLQDVLNAAGQTSTHSSYDANGNLKTLTDANQKTTTYNYDALNRVVQVTDAANGTTSTVYDVFGEPTSITDPNGSTTTYTYDNAGNVTKLISADTGTTMNTFDAADNLLKQSDARGKSQTYTYDALNRVATLKDSGSVTTTYVYDTCQYGIGRLCSVGDSTSNTNFTYDIRGHITGKTQTIGTTTLTTLYSYNAGRLNRVTYPSGSAVDYHYDVTNPNQILAVDINGQNVIGNLNYAPFGPVTQWSWSNGTTHQRQYNQDGQLTQLNLANTARTMNYDAVGLLVNLADAVNPQSFSYDVLDRLTQSTASTGTQAFEYDANGNRTRLTQNGTAATNTISAPGNRLLSTAGVAPMFYSYDASGNTLWDGKNSFTYDDRGRLASVNSKQASYGYNAFGQRVRKDIGGTLTTNGLSITGTYSVVTYSTSDPNKKDLYVRANLKNQGTSPLLGGQAGITQAAPYLTVLSDDVRFGPIGVNATAASLTQFLVRRDLAYPGSPASATDLSSLLWTLSGTVSTAQQTTLFAYDEDGQLLGEYGGTGAPVQETVWLGTIPIATVRNSVVYSVHTDHLNTPRVITNGGNTVVWRWDSDAFGSTPANEDPDNDGARFVFNLRFPGQVYDMESGLYYNYFRTYDPSTGRYIQSDPIGLKGGLNTFLYANANPLSFIDPMGLYVGFWHGQYTRMGGGRAGLTPQEAAALAQLVVDVDDDHLHPGTQDPANAHMHAMCAPGMSRAACQEKYLRYIEEQLKSCSKDGLAKAIHAVQDSFAEGHRNFSPYNGLSHLPPSHLYNDSLPTPEEMKGVPIMTQNVIERFRENCSCSK